jgi:hypothetical protein
MQTVLSKVFSTAEFIPLSWNFGELRGGSNAILVNDGHKDVYISIFHSIKAFKEKREMTYWFGAYTFSSSPPFKLLSISPVPIATNSLYDGAWFHYNNMHFDYVAYPTR